MDQAFYYFYHNDRLSGVLALHVDDILFIGNHHFYTKVINPLRQKFVISKEETTNFTFVGWDLVQTPEAIELNLSTYLNSLDFSTLEPLRSVHGPKDDLLPLDLQDLFRKAIGNLNWINLVVSPHYNYYSAYFSPLAGKATFKDAKLIMRTLTKMKNDGTVIRFHNLGEPSSWNIVAWSDSSWARTDQNICVNAHLVTLANQDCTKACILDWNSSRPGIPSTSAMAAEAEAANQAFAKITSIKYLLGEVLRLPSVHSFLITDSRSLKNTISTTKTVRDKRMQVNIAILRALSSKEDIEVIWSDAKHQLADILTKPTADPSKLINLMITGDFELPISNPPFCSSGHDGQLYEDLVPHTKTTQKEK